VTTLYRGGRILTPTQPDATALAVADGVVVWVGADEAGDRLGADKIVDVGGALVTPAFVDAHVHTTSTGLTLGELDLHDARSLAEVLDRVASFARARRGGVILGDGWDDTRWPEHRPPTAAELDRASWGSVVYLARVDHHSAVASSALLAIARPDALPGFMGDGLVRLDAHHAVRRAAYAALSPADRARAQRLALEHAASLGIGSIHEMSGPEVAGRADLESLLTLGREIGLDVRAYWGELGEAGVETARRLGISGPGGDLWCDGAVGSHTAAMSEPYADEDTCGALHYDGHEVAEHVQLTIRAGLQCGFHVIGDAAIDTVLTGFEKAVAAVGAPAVAAGRHRLEHCELLSPEAVARIARLGLVASVQPAFDACWGGPDQMYAERLGPERAARMNPLAELAAAGVPLCLSSDSPITPLDPWGGVRAAVRHRSPGQALSPKAAFAAATRGGWRAVGDDEAGVLVPGAPATFAVWDAEPVEPARADERISAWATDPWWSLTGLPDLDTTPTCQRTVVRGRTIHEIEGAHR
jgi:predicted amidohydrolase YtcJ